jgi:hypothetical protein
MCTPGWRISPVACSGWRPSAAITQITAAIVVLPD